MARLPRVVLVGRPNVGKSTLFNRVAGIRRAIVGPIPGTTRDVIEQPVAWRASRFVLTDTGGMFGASSDPLHALVVARGRRALAEADLVVLVVDGREGCLPADAEIARELRPLGVPVVVAVNKTDDRRARASAGQFHELGFDPVLEIAAEHGTGVGDLLDVIVQRLPPPGGPEPVEAPPELRVAIVGRPNVGKSSLVNRLLREERVLVSEVPGTTRDAVDAVLRWQGRTVRLVDTAGIRRPGRVSAGSVEAVSVLVARRALERAEVAILLFDASAGVTDQDAAIAGEIVDAGCGIVLAANKWDLTPGGEEFAKTFDAEVRRRLAFVAYAPLAHVSALTGARTPRLLELAARVAAERRKRVPTAELNRHIGAITAAHPPSSRRHREVRILYAVQSASAPPTFVFFTSGASTLHFSYKRFLENRLREAFGFDGTPIRIQVRARRRAPRTRPAGP